MPEGEQDHGLVAMRPAIVLAGFDQLLDLTFGEVFPCSDVGILGRVGVTFRFTVVGDTILRAGFLI
jgi:hypothetical protein